MGASMSTTRLNLTIPEQLDEYTEMRVKSGAFATKSDFVRHLIREDKRKTTEKLNQYIQEGIDSGPSEKSPEEIFAEAHAIIAAAKRNGANNKNA